MTWLWGVKPLGPEPVPEFSKWKMQVFLGDDGVLDMNGFTHQPENKSRVLRAIDAMATGMRDAGFRVDITLTHEDEMKR